MAKGTEETSSSANEAYVAPELYGSYRFKVDAKGRISLPAKFRKVLSRDLIVSRELLDRCLYVFEPQAFNEWVDQLFVSKFGGYDPAKSQHVMLKTRLKSNANDVEMDSSGRIMVKQGLRDATGIEKEVVLVGNSGYFEIWDADAYDEKIESIDLGTLYSE